jgi:hypothetical protein
MKNKIVILLLISLLSLLFLGGVLYYGANSLLELKRESAELKGELNGWLKRSKETYNLKDLLDETKKVKSQIGLYSFNPSEENQIAFISEIESIIRKTGTTGEVKSLDVTPDFSKLICSVTFAGKWDDVYHTLLALESYPVKIYLDDVSIIEEKNSDTSPKTGKILFQSPEYRASVKFTITNISKLK